MSSDDIAIRVRGLSKAYQIYDAPRDRLMQFLIPRLQRVARRPAKQYFREFWALRDVSFEVHRGETVGIIGRNGSGKSTLLQLICGTLSPTVGTVETTGRVAALLELGSGFNPEFTGRENVYMNGAVLGLSHEEVDERFDAIAAFADIGEFIDQPVKTYSSGMYVRLAFAVIAHVDADILVIDEALSVGDAVFTQKCMRFIRSFQEHGTLLFVSHDMASVQNLCRSALWLDRGRLVQHGKSKAVADAYLRDTLQEMYGDEVSLNELRQEAPEATDEAVSAGDSSLPTVNHYGSIFSVRENLPQAAGWSTGDAEILSVSLQRIPTDLQASPAFEGGERVRLSIHAVAHSRLAKPILGFLLRDRLGQDLFGENTLQSVPLHNEPVLPSQRFSAEFIFRLPMLPNGQYVLMASVADGDLHNNVQHHYLHDALVVHVSSSKVRYGLVGLAFERVTMELHHAEHTA